RIGRIDGSIFGKSQLRNVSVADGRGVFLTSPNIKLDWAPDAWLDNKLHVDSLTAERVTLSRVPKLKPTAKKGPILPGFDIHIGELRIDRLDIGPAVGGTARSGTVRGKADINHGRALVELAAVMNNGGDRIAFHLDAEPDRNKFDVFTKVIAPADGLVPALIGTHRAVNLVIGGQGSWNRYRGMRLGIDLLKPPALFPNMTGKSVRMVWTLDGPFATADYSYRLTSDFVQFDNSGFTGLHAEGRGRLTPWPMRVPIRLAAKAITGVGDVAGAMLANPQIVGWLSITPKLVQGQDLRLTSAKWNGKLSLLIDLVTGRFDVLLSGAMQRYLIPGIGLVDVVTDLHVAPGPNGHGSHVVGTAKAWVRRLDNRFFQSLTGGLPSLTTNLQRATDGIVHFTNL